MQPLGCFGNKKKSTWHVSRENIMKFLSFMIGLIFMTKANVRAMTVFEGLRGNVMYLHYVNVNVHSSYDGGLSCGTTRLYPTSNHSMYFSFSGLQENLLTVMKGELLRLTDKPIDRPPLCFSIRQDMTTKKESLTPQNAEMTVCILDIVDNKDMHVSTRDNVNKMIISCVYRDDTDKSLSLYFAMQNKPVPDAELHEMLAKYIPKVDIFKVEHDQCYYFYPINIIENR